MTENDQTRSHEPPESEPRSSQAPPGSIGSQEVDQSNEIPDFAPQPIPADRCPDCYSKLAKLDSGEYEPCIKCLKGEVDPEIVLAQIRPILDENLTSTVIWAIERYTRERADVEDESWRMLEHTLYSAFLMADYLESGSYQATYRENERLRKQNKELRSRLAQ